MFYWKVYFTCCNMYLWGKEKLFSLLRSVKRDSVFIRVAVSRFPTPALRRGREEESPDSIEQDALL